jgi:membrane-associated protease RseP (regulator of RpoE activity)
VAEATARGPAWRINLWLFLGTVASVFGTFFLASLGDSTDVRRAAVDAGQFTGSLLTILVAHELAHYVAARIHEVDASLPYFIPMPLSPFGTMGAVIRMRDRIPTRKALLDIGASGPLAGLAFAIPLYVWGAHHSEVKEVTGPAVELGESIAIKLIDRFAAPHVPEGKELFLSPVAFGAWGGMFITMINLLPVGQLDGGHVAYALFGPRQDKIAQWVHRSMLAFFFVSLAMPLVRDLHAGIGLYRVGMHVHNALFWLVWFEVLAILGALSAAHPPEPGSLSVRDRALGIVGLLVLAGVGREKHSLLLWGGWFVGLALLLAMEARSGALRKTSLLDHPPTGAAKLTPGRAAVAILTLVAFALLFMPQPISM